MKYQGKITDPKDLVTKEYVDTGLSGKQNTLTFDDVPTAGSSNPVKSSGIKSAINDKADQNDLTSIHATGSTNATGAKINAGTYFYLNGSLVQAKTDIDSGATFTSGTNYTTVLNGVLTISDKSQPWTNVNTTQLTVYSVNYCWMRKWGRLVEFRFDVKTKTGASGAVLGFTLNSDFAPTSNLIFLSWKSGTSSFCKAYINTSGDFGLTGAEASTEYTINGMYLI